MNDHWHNLVQYGEDETECQICGLGAEVERLLDIIKSLDETAVAIENDEVCTETERLRKRVRRLETHLAQAHDCAGRVASEDKAIEEKS